MKNYIKTGLLATVSLFALNSCKMELEPYSDPNTYLAVTAETNDWGTVLDDQSLTYSFYGLDESITQDTIYFEVYIMGHLSDEDRFFTLKQVELAQDGSDEIYNAVAGTHYVSFDDESVSSLYFIPAGATSATVPVILKRDATLKENAYSLYIELTDNENFTVASPDTNNKLISLTEVMVKPSTWGDVVDYYIGDYGLRKHELMIMICDMYGFSFDAVMASINAQDSYCSYYVYYLQYGLTELEASGVDTTEYAEYGGQAVKFESSGF